MANASSAAADQNQGEPDRARRVPRGFPQFDLKDTIAVAQAIADNNAGKPYSRLSLAESIGRKPDSSAFRALLSASIAYGLTEGSYKQTQIKLTALGEAATMPQSEDEKRKALVKATRSIALYEQIYTKFDQAKLPADQLFRNTLIREHGVDASYADEFIKLFKSDGKFTGLIRNVAGSDRVDLQQEHLTGNGVGSGSYRTDEDDDDEMVDIDAPVVPTMTPPAMQTPAAPAVPAAPPNTNVFISHGKNRELVEHLKKVVGYSKLTPIVSVEITDTSKPVPQKVLEEMRSCFGGIVHVRSEGEWTDSDGKTHPKINDNVLIEIGAAMAIYKDNFILLAEKDVTLPSNLQGLFVCKYEGATMDGDATMRLLEGLSKFKPHS